MKGQFFIIAGVLVALILFLIGNVWSIYTLANKNEMTSESTTSWSLKQIMSEYEHIIDFHPNNESIEENFRVFSQFLMADGIYHLSFIIISNPSNASIIVNNYYPQKISNITVIGSEEFDLGELASNNSMIHNVYNNIGSPITVKYVYNGMEYNETVNISDGVNAIMEIYTKNGNFFLKKKVFYTRQDNN